MIPKYILVLFLKVLSGEEGYLETNCDTYCHVCTVASYCFSEHSSHTDIYTVMAHYNLVKEMEPLYISEHDRWIWDIRLYAGAEDTESIYLKLYIFHSMSGCMQEGLSVRKDIKEED